MIRILSAHAQNFRSYETLAYSVPEAGVILVDGRNEDTGGSNGAGKTTVLDLLTWVLYGTLPRGGLSDSVVRKGEKTCRGVVDLMVNGQTWVIERKRPLKLIVTIDGVAQERKAADLQAMIEERVMPLERFLIAVYISQGRSSGFFSTSDAQRTELLSQVANLAKLDAAHDRAKAERDRLRKTLELTEFQKKTFVNILEQDEKYLTGRQYELTKVGSELSTAQANLEVSAVAFEKTLQMISVEVESEKLTLDELHNAIDTDLNKHIVQLQAQLLDKETALAAAYQPLNPNLEASVQLAKSRMKAAEEQSMARARAMQHNEQLGKRVLDLKTQALQVLDSGKCGECNQLLPEERRISHADRLRSDADALMLKVVPVADEADVEAARAALDSVVQAFAEARAAASALPNQISSQISIIKQQVTIKKNELSASKTSKDAAVRRLQLNADEKLSAVRRDVETKQLALESVRKQAQNTITDIERLEARIADNRGKADQFTKDIDNLQDDVNLHEELVLLFGPKGYRAACFTGLIAQVSSQANQYALRLTDGKFGTELKQVTEDSKGQSKIVLRPIITMGGEEVPVEFLSGGQLQRLSAAYDLAINSVASDGLPLILDEAFAFIDAEGKSVALELLNEIARERCCFVVDHTDSFKTAIDRYWLARMSGGVSQLETGDVSSEGIAAEAM